MTSDARTTAPIYTESQARRWLSHLARGMKLHGQTVFMIEQLQPTWLINRKHQIAYISASHLTWNIAIGVFVIMTFLLIIASSPRVIQDFPFDRFFLFLFFLIPFGWVMFFPVALIFGLIDIIVHRVSFLSDQPSGATFVRFMRSALKTGIIAILIFGVGHSLIRMRLASGYPFLLGPFVFGLCFGLIVGQYNVILCLHHSHASQSTPGLITARFTCDPRFFIKSLVLTGAVTFLILWLSGLLLDDDLMNRIIMELGIYFGLILGITYIVLYKFRNQQIARPLPDAHWNIAKDILFLGAIAGLISTPLLTIFHHVIVGKEPFGHGTIIALGLFYGVAFTAIWMARSVRRMPQREIKTVETLAWSWESSYKVCCIGLILGLAYGCIVAALAKLLPRVVSTASFWDTLFVIAMFVSLGGFLGGLAGGISPRVREMKVRPNEGIRLSLRNGLKLGGLTLVLLALFAGIFYFWRCPDYTVKIVAGLTFGSSVGLLVFFFYGGLDVIQHFILRLLLYFAGLAPLRYGRFLDYAADELHFLQKVGGGYIFVHRYLLEHFAAMEEHDAGSGPKSHD
jgi:hypothetical protein